MQSVCFTFEEDMDGGADNRCFTLNVPEIETGPETIQLVKIHRTGVVENAGKI